jgi:hypothetical protein
MIDDPEVASVMVVVCGITYVPEASVMTGLLIAAA